MSLGSPPPDLMRLLSANDTDVEQFCSRDPEDYQCWCCTLCDPRPSKHHQKVTFHSSPARKLTVDVTLNVEEPGGGDGEGPPTRSTPQENGVDHGHILISDMWDTSFEQEKTDVLGDNEFDESVSTQ